MRPNPWILEGLGVLGRIMHCQQHLPLLQENFLLLSNRPFRATATTLPDQQRSYVCRTGLGHKIAQTLTRMLPGVLFRLVVVHQRRIVAQKLQRVETIRHREGRRQVPFFLTSQACSCFCNREQVNGYTTSHSKCQRERGRHIARATRARKEEKGEEGILYMT